jgi:amino acid permease
MIPIKDIKPNVEIIDYEFIAFVAISLIFFIILSIFLIKKFKKKNPKKEILKKLKNLDFENSKKTAYEFTDLARNFINDENKNEYEKIVNMLEKYKYKKQVPHLDKKTKEKIISFIKEISV